MIIISLLISVNCPDPIDVKLGFAKCEFRDGFLQDDFDYWDEGRNCLLFCIRKMNENNWQKGCCEAEKMPGGFKTLCKIHDKADVVRPGDSSTKAVQCTGIWTAFDIGH